ncbi:hypothetical protein BJ742DRAFT_766325 [Cladochytrium replicatum]|nr:hypothetical protein BJ742DRAFT_766325 [Cladochytrium replicatum]
MQPPPHSDNQNHSQQSSQSGQNLQYHDSRSSSAYLHPQSTNPPPYPRAMHRPHPPHHQQQQKSLAMGPRYDDYYDNYGPPSSEDPPVHDRDRSIDDRRYSDITHRHQYQDTSSTPPPSLLAVEKRRRDPEDLVVSDTGGGPFKKRSYSNSTHGLQHLQQTQPIPSPTAAQPPAANGQGGFQDGVVQLPHRSHSRSPRPSAPESHHPRSPPSDYSHQMHPQQHHPYYSKGTSNPAPPYYPYGPSHGNQHPSAGYYHPHQHFQPPKEGAEKLKDGEYKVRYISMKKQCEYIKRENEMLAEEYAMLKSKLKRLKVEKNIVLESLFAAELSQLQQECGTD